MFVVSQHTRARAQRTYGDNQVGQWEHFSGAVHLPGQVLGRLPDVMIGRHMDNQIEERYKLRLRLWAGDSAQDFAAHHAATDQLHALKSIRQFSRRIAMRPEEFDVNRRVNEDHWSSR